MVAYPAWPHCSSIVMELQSWAKYGNISYFYEERLGSGSGKGLESMFRAMGRVRSRIRNRVRISVRITARVTVKDTT